MKKTGWPPGLGNLLKVWRNTLHSQLQGPTLFLAPRSLSIHVSLSCKYWWRHIFQVSNESYWLKLDIWYLYLTRLLKKALANQVWALGSGLWAQVQARGTSRPALPPKLMIEPLTSSFKILLFLNFVDEVQRHFCLFPMILLFFIVRSQLGLKPKSHERRRCRRRRRRRCRCRCRRSRCHHGCRCCC